MPSTYTPIATQTLTGTSSQITFSSIPATYTDIRLIASFQDTGQAAYIRLNSDSGSNYSRTVIYGYTTGAISTRGTSLTNLPFGGAAAGFYDISTLDFLNYSNTTTNKTSLMRQNSYTSSTDIFVASQVFLWRSTAAINQIDIYATSANSLKAGSTFTLYGIKAA